MILMWNFALQSKNAGSHQEMRFWSLKSLVIPMWNSTLESINVMKKFGRPSKMGLRGHWRWGICPELVQIEPKMKRYAECEIKIPLNGPGTIRIRWHPFEMSTEHGKMEKLVCQPHSSIISNLPKMDLENLNSSLSSAHSKFNVIWNSSLGLLDLGIWCHPFEVLKDLRKCEGHLHTIFY